MVGVLFACLLCKVPRFSVVGHYRFAVANAHFGAVGKCCYACYCGGIRLRAGISQETSQVHVFQTAVQQFAQRHVGKVCQNAADFTVDNFTDSEVLYFVKYGIEGTSRNVCNAQVYKCAVQRGHFGVVQTVFYKFFIGCAGVVAWQNGRVVPNKTVAVVAVHVVLFRAGKFRLIKLALFFLDKVLFFVFRFYPNGAVFRRCKHVVAVCIGNFVAYTAKQTSHIEVFKTAVQQFAHSHVGKVCQNAADFTVDNFTDSEVLYFVKYGIEGTSRNVCNAQVYKCAVQRGHFGVVQTVFYKFFIGCAGVVAWQNGRVVPNKTVAVVAVHVVLFRAGKFRLIKLALFFLDKVLFFVFRFYPNGAVFRRCKHVVAVCIGNFVADTTQQTSHIGVVDDVVHVDFAVFAHKVDNQRVAKQRGKRACLTTQQVGDFHLSQGFQRSAVLQLQKQTVVTAKRGVQFAHAGLSDSPHKGVVAVGVGGEVFRQQLGKRDVFENVGDTLFLCHQFHNVVVGKLFHHVVVDYCRAVLVFHKEVQQGRNCADLDLFQCTLHSVVTLTVGGGAEKFKNRHFQQVVGQTHAKQVLRIDIVLRTQISQTVVLAVLVGNAYFLRIQRRKIFVDVK